MIINLGVIVKKKTLVIDEDTTKRYIMDCLARNDKKALTTFCNRLIDEGGADGSHILQLVLSCKMALSTNNVK